MKKIVNEREGKASISFLSRFRALLCCQGYNVAISDGSRYSIISEAWRKKGIYEGAVVHFLNFMGAYANDTDLCMR